MKRTRKLRLDSTDRRQLAQSWKAVMCNIEQIMRYARFLDATAKRYFNRVARERNYGTITPLKVAKLDFLDNESWVWSARAMEHERYSRSLLLAWRLTTTRITKMPVQFLVDGHLYAHSPEGTIIRSILVAIRGRSDRVVCVIENEAQFCANGKVRWNT